MTVFQNEQDSAGMLKKVYTGSFQNPRQDFEIKLTAGEFKTLNITYSSFWVINNTAPGDVTFDFGQSGRPTKLEEGEGFSLPFAVSKLTLHNTGAGSATIKFSYGMAELYDNRTSISGTVQTIANPPVYSTVTATIRNIAAGGYSTLNLSGNHVLIQNISTDPGTIVSISNTSGARIYKGGTIEVDFNGSLAIRNLDSVNQATISVNIWS